MYRKFDTQFTCIKGIYPVMNANKNWRPPKATWEDLDHPWSTPILNCYDDRPACVRGLFCYCTNLGLASQNLDQNGWLVPCCASLIGCFALDLRYRIRQRHNIKGSKNYDFLVSTFCLPCSTCQMYRESKIHNLRYLKEEEEIQKIQNLKQKQDQQEQAQKRKLEEQKRIEEELSQQVQQSQEQQQQAIP